MPASWKIMFTIALISASGVRLDSARAASTLQLSNPDGGEVRALVIGIDDYQHVRKLKGATADAHDIDSSLRTMGVRDVTALINDRADRPNVLREISALVERTKTNDIVFLSIAGHGAQEPERIKGSQPDGMEDVFLLPGFEATPTEVRVPGIDGLRGALSYAVARAIEGNADADHDGKVTLKEFFANIRQVVYQLSDQRQNVVTLTSPNRSPDIDVAFGLTRGVTLIQGPIEGPQPSAPQSLASLTPASTSLAAGGIAPIPLPDPAAQIAGQVSPPVRLAALDGKTSYFPSPKSRDSTFQAVQPTDNPDLIWDPVSHDVIAWGDVIAYGIDPADLPTVIDRTAAIRTLKGKATQSPQVMRVSPDDRLHRNDQTVNIDLSEVGGRAVVLFNVSGDGTIQMLYPIGSDASPVRSANLRLPLRVSEPFGAEQVVAVTSPQRMVDFENALQQLNHRRASGQVIKSLERYMPADARVGSVGFFTVP